MTDVLTTNKLTIGYRASRSGAENAVLRDLELCLPESSLTVLIGGNGAGKSTLLRTLSGAQAPLSGSVSISGLSIERMSLAERARKVALVYTDRAGGGGLTVRELVGLGRQPHTGFFGRLSAEDRQIVDDCMGAVGIGGKAEDYVATLSDGERQKAMIARALAQQTPLIILDEPTAFLDVASRLEVLELLRSITVDEGKTVLLSTHDLAPSIAVADRLWVIDGYSGAVAQGDKANVVASGVMDRVFPDRNIRFSTAINDYVIG